MSPEAPLSMTLLSLLSCWGISAPWDKLSNVLVMRTWKASFCVSVLSIPVD